MGAVVVMGIYPFFVEISVGGLKQRTHLAGTSLHHASRETSCIAGKRPVRGLRGSIERVKMITM